MLFFFKWKWFSTWFRLHFNKSDWENVHHLDPLHEMHRVIVYHWLDNGKKRTETVIMIDWVGVQQSRVLSCGLKKLMRMIRLAAGFSKICDATKASQSNMLRQTLLPANWQ